MDQASAHEVFREIAPAVPKRVPRGAKHPPESTTCLVPPEQRRVRSGTGPNRGPVK